MPSCPKPWPRGGGRGGALLGRPKPAAAPREPVQKNSPNSRVQGWREKAQGFPGPTSRKTGSECGARGLACRTAERRSETVLCFALQGSRWPRRGGLIQGKVRLLGLAGSGPGTAPRALAVSPGSHLAHHPSRGKRLRLYGHSVCIICISLPHQFDRNSSLLRGPNENFPSYLSAGDKNLVWELIFPHLWDDEIKDQSN